MIIGAQSRDFSSIIDASPECFGIFYWSSSEDPKTKHHATITKAKPGYCYEFKSGVLKADLAVFDQKEDLIARMEVDNLKYNRGGKCTVEF